MEASVVTVAWLLVVNDGTAGFLFDRFLIGFHDTVTWLPWIPPPVNALEAATQYYLAIIVIRRVRWRTADTEASSRRDRCGCFMDLRRVKKASNDGGLSESGWV